MSSAERVILANVPVLQANSAGRAAAFDFYRQCRYSGWTYFFPPSVDFFVGERHGEYRVGSDEPVADSDGNARLSYLDAAVAIVEETEPLITP
jgi:putative NADH-flavin reductase